MNNVAMYRVVGLTPAQMPGKWAADGLPTSSTSLAGFRLPALLPFHSATERPMLQKLFGRADLGRALDCVCNNVFRVNFSAARQAA